MTPPRPIKLATSGWTPEALHDPHAAPDKPERVRAMFARMAHGYDRANRLHSFGRDLAWRLAAARVAVRPGDEVLDVACGTGDLAWACLRAGAAGVVGLDFSSEMLAIARRKYGATPIRFVEGDALALPFPPASFDAVTIGFGLRNVADTGRALAEFLRVLRPGSRLGVLEFAMPRGGILGALGRFFIRRVIPVTGRLITGDNGGAYRYLAASVDRYLTFEQLRSAMGEAGFVEVRTARTMAFGSVGVHLGVRP